MEPLVIFASRYGNTERVARAIGAGLGSGGNNYVVASIDHVTAAAIWDADLVAIGGPTHMHGISLGLRRFLRRVPEGSWRGVRVVAFDTRFRGEIGQTGSAAVKIAEKLRKRGAIVDVPPESFFVAGMQGPLADGEPERAEAWGRELAGMLGQSRRAA
jgi:flavodoxin